MKWFCNVMFLLMVFIVGLQVDVSASYCEPETYVFHANGMFTEKWEAESNVTKLQLKMHESGGLSDDQWSFQLSYNHNEGTSSLYEVFRQRMGDHASSYWRWLGSMEIAPDWFQSAASNVASSIDLAEAVIDEDLKEHVQRYQGLLMEGNRVLVVAHSQGNLYANAAYTNLAANDLPMEAFGIVSVANPASHVAGNGPYYTLLNDLVIAAVRLVFPDTLEGNVANALDFSDWTHHGFVESYLNGSQSGPLIIDSILGEANALSWPTPQVGKGPISVTMTWGEQPDVDLHLFEPNGSHVYYAAPLGQSGFLDHDDSRSYGPEHYYVTSCDFLETGTYSVAANYYRGEGPEVAHFQIQAGDIVRDYTVPLFMAFGSSGNFRTWPVANIEVLGDAEQGYEFKVYEQ